MPINRAKISAVKSPRLTNTAEELEKAIGINEYMRKRQIQKQMSHPITLHEISSDEKSEINSSRSNTAN